MQFKFKVDKTINIFLTELFYQILKKENKQDFREVIEIILQLCRNHLKNDRLAISLIKTVDLIVQNDLLVEEQITQAHIPVEFLNLFMENVRVTKDMTKLNAYVDFFCDMLQFEEDRIRERFTNVKLFKWHFHIQVVCSFSIFPILGQWFNWWFCYATSIHGFVRQPPASFSRLSSTTPMKCSKKKKTTMSVSNYWQKPYGTSPSTKSDRSEIVYAIWPRHQSQW